MSNTVERRNIYPTPPAMTVMEDFEDIQIFANAVQRHLSNVALYSKYKEASLLDVLEDDIEAMSVDKLTAGTLDVDKVFVGGSSFELDGVLTQLRIKDQQGTPVTRVEMGIFATGSDAGIKIRNAAGTVIFQTGDTTFIDGVVISDNTIVADAMNVTNLAAIEANLGAVTAGSITGLLIRTSASNPRVELTTTGIAGYNSGGTVIFDLTTSGTVRLGDAGADNILFSAGVLSVTGDIIGSGNIQANTVTGDEILVANLSAISANMGTLTAGSITAGSITAGTINNGTLPFSDSGPDMTVTGKSNVIFSGGADIIMRSAPSGNSSMIRLQNSSGTDRFAIIYNQSSNKVFINPEAATEFILGNGAVQTSILGSEIVVVAKTRPSGGSVDLGDSSNRFRDFYFSGILRGDADVTLESTTGGTIRIGNGTSTDVIFNSRLRADLDPYQNNTINLGSASLKYADVQSVLIQGADFCFANGWRLTEPDRVYSDADPKAGIYLMDEDWNPQYFFSNDGTLFCKGVVQKYPFRSPNVPRRESKRVEKELDS